MYIKKYLNSIIIKTVPMKIETDTKEANLLSNKFEALKFSTDSGNKSPRVRNNKTPAENDKEPARKPFESVIRKSFRNGIKGNTKSSNGIIDPTADESAAITVNPNPSPTLPLASTL